MSGCLLPWSYSEKITVFPPFGLRLTHQSPEKEILQEISPSTTYDPGWGWGSSQMGYHENLCLPWFYCVKCDFLHFRFYYFDLSGWNSYNPINLDPFKNSYILKLLKWFDLIIYGLILLIFQVDRFEKLELYRCSSKYLQNIFPNFMLTYVEMYVYQWPSPSLTKILLVTLI